MLANYAKCYSFTPPQWTTFPAPLTSQVSRFHADTDMQKDDISAHPGIVAETGPPAQVSDPLAWHGWKQPCLQPPAGNCPTL